MLPWGTCDSRVPKEPFQRPKLRLCCFVLLIPTPEEYRVPRVNPGVTASKLFPPLLHCLLLQESSCSWLGLHKTVFQGDQWAMRRGEVGRNCGGSQCASSRCSPPSPPGRLRARVRVPDLRSLSLRSLSLRKAPRLRNVVDCLTAHCLTCSVHSCVRHRRSPL